MAYQRKLGRTASQRKALLRGLTTNLINNGKIETTEAKPKEVRRIAERLITLAVKEHENTVTVTKEFHNDKGQLVQQEVVNDAPSKLAARRQILSYLYNVPVAREEDERKADYKARQREVKYPVVEKLFREIAPACKERNGGYTRMYKMGPRRGDGAEMALIKLVADEKAAKAEPKSAAKKKEAKVEEAKAE